MSDINWQLLRERLQGKLVQVDDSNYSTHFKPFSSTGVKKSDGDPARPLAVLFPRSAQDVSEGVQFATQHTLTLSVKSGGYNPSNWSSAGQLVVDLSALREMHLEHVPTEAVNRAKRRWEEEHDEVSTTSEQPRQRSLPPLAGASTNGTSYSPITAPHSAGLTSSGIKTDNDASSAIDGGATSTQTIDIRDRLSPPPSRISAPAVLQKPSDQDPSVGGLTSKKDNVPDIGNGRERYGEEDQTRSGEEQHESRTGTSSPMQLDPSASSSSCSARANSGNSNRSARSSSSNGPSSSTTSASSSNGRHLEDSPDTTTTSVSNQSSDDSGASRLSDRAAGKRRMLGRDRDSSHSSTEMHLDAPHPHHLSELLQSDATSRDESRQHQSRPSNGTSKSEGSPFLLASSYPPLNLANAALPSGLDEQSLASHYEQVSGSNRDGNSTVPFNYDVSKGVAHLSSPTAPPGAIPPFLSSNGSQSQLNGASGAFYQFSPNPSFPQSGSSQADPTATPAASTSSSSSSALAESLSFGVQDPSAYITVTFGSGVKARDLDNFTAPSGYFVPLACYPVGSAIFTTGGYGFVSRLFGLSMDLTLELEIVLPVDGRIVHLRDYKNDPDMSVEEKQEQEELWFACRGAGTAFGIVTKIKAKAFKIGKVLSGNIIYPYNPITTPSLIKHWRDCLKAAPRELYTNLTLTAGPSPSGHVVVVQFSWCGKTTTEGEILLQAILSWSGERCLMKDVEVRPYAEQQVNVSQILASKEGARWLVRSTLTKSLTDEAIHQTVKRFHSVTCGTSWLFEVAGGAIAEPPLPTCYPISHRTCPFQLAALHQWTQSDDDDENKRHAEGWIYDVFNPKSSPPSTNNKGKAKTNGEHPDGSIEQEQVVEEELGCGPFPCFLASGEGRERMIKVYGRENWNRLVKLKRKYDPQGLLRYTHFENELLKMEEEQGTV